MAEQSAKNHTVIGSDRVEGTSVYGKDKSKMGEVRRVMLDKESGQARDVEIAVGTFLGMGGELHSLPWQKFNYDTDLDGYRLDVTEDQLKNAPTHSEKQSDREYDRDYQDEVYTYWEVTPYWLD